VAAAKIVRLALIVESVSTSETSANFYETTRCNIPESCHSHARYYYVREYHYHVPVPMSIRLTRFISEISWWYRWNLVFAINTSSCWTNLIFVWLVIFKIYFTWSTNWTYPIGSTYKILLSDKFIDHVKRYVFILCSSRRGTKLARHSVVCS
jgi:hypothetical protein